MRILLILLLTLIPAAAGAQTTLSVRAITDSMLVLLLNEGREVSIENLDGSPNLIPRLWSISDEGQCVEDTHMICTHRYFLAVSEDGEAAAQTVFDLGEVGEIAAARVSADDGFRNPRLRVVVVNYPAHVFQYAPELVRQERVYLIHLGLQTLRITPEP